MKLDSLGRRNNGWANAGPGRNKLYGAALTEFYNLRLDKETMDLLKARAKRDKKTIADILRNYIEWGLENEE